MSVTREYIKPGDVVIDATCGTGRDTVALAEAVGSTGTVLAFDIQPQAVRMTEERLREHGISSVISSQEGDAKVHLIVDSFVTMGEYLRGESAAAVIFNLGYLPGGDHSVTTLAETTIKGLECALALIRPGGIVTVVMYDGHKEGAEEKRQVLEWAKQLDPCAYHAAFVDFMNQRNDPPEILWITKKKSSPDSPAQMSAAASPKTAETAQRSRT